jgi:osmotically-inducible protein OsmY
MNARPIAPILVLLAVAATPPLLAGCVAVAAGALAGGALVVADRRSAGAQLDDESIELKIASETRGRYGGNVHVNATSYNGIVLLTGEVPDARTQTGLTDLAKSVPRVREVHNETVIAPATSLADRSNDTLITSKVKTRLIEANQVPANLIKVVTERNVVYLMGIVSRAEADAATNLAATTSGVARVVRVFEYTG